MSRDEGKRGKRVCGDRDEPLPVPERFQGEVLDTPDKLEKYFDGPVKQYEPRFKDRENFEIFAMCPLDKNQQAAFFAKVAEKQREIDAGLPDRFAPPDFKSSE